MARQRSVPWDEEHGGRPRARNARPGHVKPDEAPLQELPYEVPNHVIDFLETQCPSEVNWHQKPDPSLTQSDCHDLKHLSRTSQQMRHFVLPRLFTHLSFALPNLHLLLSFLKTNNLTSHVTSLVERLAPRTPYIEKPRWLDLLNAIPDINTLTILAPPALIADALGTSVPTTDSWLFKMPYHVLRLRQPQPLPSTEWTHLSLHESSFLKAYSQYEYFFRVPPSLVPKLARLYPKLTSFSYTAIFPFYNHVDILLTRLASLKHLMSLTTRLAPHPASTIIEQEIAAAKGYIDVNDAWMEFETSYVLIGETVGKKLPGLREYVCLDVEVEGLREELEGGLTERLGDQWACAGEATGRWHRVESGAREIGIGTEEVV